MIYLLRNRIQPFLSIKEHQDLIVQVKDLLIKEAIVSFMNAQKYVPFIVPAIADVWSLRSLEMVSKWLPIAVEDPSNDEARSQVM